MLFRFITLILFSFTSWVVYAHEVAITIDNPNIEETPLLSPLGRDKAILNTLQRNHLKIILFVQGAQVDNNEGKKLLKRWNKAGHIIGNHTYSHRGISEISEPEYEQDTLRNEKFLQPYTQFRKIFRFPYLKEGETIEKRDAFRNFLHTHGYKFGSVTIDASDWYISDRLEKRLKVNPNADLTAYKKYYLHHIWSRAQYYDTLAQDVIGRSPKHILLIHHNLLNALFLDDLIQMFKAKGWKLINADKALNDPIFKLTPNIVPAGESLIWGLAKETGRYDDKLRYPGEDGSYEKDKMDKLGL